MSSDEHTYQWLLSWVVMIAVLMLLNKTRIGHVFLYYSFALMILLLLVLEYPFISGALLGVSPLSKA